MHGCIGRVGIFGRDGSCIGAGLICVIGRLDDINKNCLEEFRKHWECLDNNNQQLWHCRRPEQLLNACVFDKLVRLSLPHIEHTLIKTLTQKLEKMIPGAPENETPVHLRDRQIFSHNMSSYRKPE